ncbi:hypothetical protein [Thermoanaerobacterium sp. DL9XJH110]|uniref:hypothetical protein n=1 Tax=Thermoanaerobacterium sp. DL9XJH110 TaxID=3386643 RepID=UPI003BB7CC08
MNLRKKEGVIFMWNWLIANKEWIFSGIGVAVLTVIFSLFKSKRDKRINQKQIAGDSSMNIQIGEIVKINKSGDDVEC